MSAATFMMLVIQSDRYQSGVVSRFDGGKPWWFEWNYFDCGAAWLNFTVGDHKTPIFLLLLALWLRFATNLAWREILRIHQFCCNWWQDDSQSGFLSCQTSDKRMLHLHLYFVGRRRGEAVSVIVKFQWEYPYTAVWTEQDRQDWTKVKTTNSLITSPL